MYSPDNQPNEETIRRLSEYVDGTLEPKAAVELIQRVATNRALQKELEALRSADALIKAHRDEVPEIDWDAFSNSVRIRIEKTSKSTPRTLVFPLWRPLAAAAALALSVTAFLIVERNPTTPQPLVSAAHIDVSVEGPTNGPSDAARGKVIASVSRQRPDGMIGFDADFVGPPYFERSILVATGVN